MENTKTPLLTSEQDAALELLLDAVRDKATAALIGPAGSGKTTVIRALLERLGADRCVVICPTHKARRVVAAGLPDARTATVAATLRLRPGINGDTGAISFSRGNVNPDASGFLQDGQPPSALILDEASMVISGHVHDLEVLAGKLGAALLLVGDEAQLDPVSPSASGVRGLQTMAWQFVCNPRTARLETVMRTGIGPVLNLSRDVRHSTDLRGIWPAESLYSDASQIVLHEWPNAWLAAATAAVNSDEWADNPDYARVLTWTHREALRVGELIRQNRFPGSQTEWHPGEWISAPSGIPCLANALGNPIAPACSEFKILSVEPAEHLAKTTGAFTWHTPARHEERHVLLTATTNASVAVVQHDDQQIKLLLEPPDQIGSWSSQCKELRRLVKTKFDGTAADRRALFKKIADLETWIPNLRSAVTQTIHSSQGSSYQQVFVARDLRHALIADPADAQRLAYVAVSRARGTLHLQPLNTPNQ